jgi:hypothetical protein
VSPKSLKIQGEHMQGRTLKIVAVMLMVGAAAIAQTIPAGTKIIVRMSKQINSGTAKAGDAFHANLNRDLVVDGKTIAKAGAPVRGKVTYAKASGRLHDPGELTLRLTSVEMHGKFVPVSTSAIREKGQSHTKSNAVKIGGGAAAGTVLGAAFGGGKGALIGAGAGAAAGTGVAAATGKEEAVVHAESAVTFTTTATTTASPVAKAKKK